MLIKRFSLPFKLMFLAISFSFLANILLTPTSAKAVEPSAVTVAMSLTPLSAPFIIAEHLNYFVEGGLNVTIKDFVGGNRTANAMLAGEADIATSSEAVVMFNSFKRQDFAIISTFVSSDNDVKILTRKSTGISRVSN